MHFLVPLIDSLKHAIIDVLLKWLSILWMNVQGIDYLKYANFFNGGINPLDMYNMFLFFTVFDQPAFHRWV